MKRLLSLNNFYLLVLLILLSCDNTTNDNSCSGSEIRDNCGICRLPDDDNFDSCYDSCGIQNGYSDCSPYGKCMGLCECDGCFVFGNLNYDPEAQEENQCACDWEQLSSNFEITDLDYSIGQYPIYVNFDFIDPSGVFIPGMGDNFVGLPELAASPVKKPP